MQEPKSQNIGKPVRLSSHRAPNSKLIDTVRRLTDLYNFSPLGYLILDKSARIQDVNLTADIMLGIPSSQLAGQSLYPLIVRAHRDTLFLHLRSLFKKQGPKGCELQIKAEDRDSRWIYMKSILDQDLQGRPACRAVLVDIEEHKQAEHERDALETQNRYTRKPESLGVLTGGIAHNFNNILQAILGNAELALINSPQGSPAKDHLTNILKESQRAAELCRQMLAYAGKGNLMIRPLDVSALVAEMVPLLKKSISREVALDYRFAKNLPSIKGDATQIRQLITNLVINAFEAVGEKEGLVSLAVDVDGCKQSFRPGMLQMENLAEGKYVVVEVKDTGCGMNPAIRERIFEPFFTTKFNGRGLGLAAAAGIVQAHGGDIKVYSRPGMGTTATVFLPVG